MTESQSTRYIPQYPTGDSDEENTRFLVPATGAEAEAEKHDGCQEKPKGWPKGWRFTLSLAAFVGVLVFGFNLGFVLWAITHHNLSNGRGVLYDGDCDHMHDLSVGFHLVINIFSTILLGASNFTMLDWLDIGVPSVRNFRRISRKRAILWIILVLSSLPLHLIYNSTIFATLSSNAYYVFLGDEPLGRNSPEDMTLVLPTRFPYEPGDSLYSPPPEGTVYDYEPQRPAINSTFTRLYSMGRNKTLKYLDNSACLDAYATTYQTAYLNLLLVTDKPKNESEYLVVDYQRVFSPSLYRNAIKPEPDPYRWLCPEEDEISRSERDQKDSHDCRFHLPDIRAQVAASNWTVGSHQVRFCLAEPAPAHCKLQYSLPLTVIVIIFIAIKVTAICYVALTTISAILTTGDAVASFIRTPDETTRGKCLLSMKDITKAPDASKPSWFYQIYTGYNEKPERWHSAVANRRWTLGYGFSTISDSSGIWLVGLQATDPRTLIVGDWPTSLVSNTLMANLPQLIYSIIYFAFNSIVTTMTMAAEWSQYAVQRKGLRVRMRLEYRNGAPTSSHCLTATQSRLWVHRVYCIGSSRKAST
ncbi:hypothetical protein MGYG_05717 [Nannizzia gypsea CBS 118893]|uniref:DUF6536 domain-containing protein n=1 Tax=Arthroderma gypseum (strain ATCC MYA-4604 / CBS 118893) TaxID=535722 RepID=E4UXI5_ARTGP|nr:hypothetical protein MGYG_05717 [Nannizzia gypsea CBS 118893]EFR02719.1 hypothetical protein MGYG_05717 [Nannizzia gypsea CBS 118893]